MLYNPRGEWRYAIYNDREVLDGFLANLHAHVSAEQAQTHLLALVEEMDRAAIQRDLEIRRTALVVGQPGRPGLTRALPRG